MGIFDEIVRRAPGVLAQRQAGKLRGEATRYDRDREEQEFRARARAEAIQQALMERRQAREDEDRSYEISQRPVKERFVQSQIAENERQAQPKPVAPPPTPWQKEGFEDEDSYLKFEGKKAAVTRAPRAAGDGTAGPMKFNVGNSLRDDFNTLTKPYQVVRTGLEQMKSLAQDQTGASDINLLIAAAKIADPESVVREGEVAIQRTAASLADRIGVKFQNILNGQLLSPDQRQKLVAASMARVPAHRANYERYRQQYGKLASKYGGDEWDVVGDDPEAPAPAPDPPPGAGGFDPAAWLAAHRAKKKTP